MPDKPNNPFQFWQELKRRKVIRVIAMYVAAAYVIIELSNNVVEPLSLPAWTSTMIIVLLVIGFPFAVIFSWIFDITPEGVKKTESIEVTKEQESLLVPVKRRLRVSDFIIAVLVVVVVILAYPKIFKKDKFEDLRDDDGRISVVVMPFQNFSGDTLYDGYELGLQDHLISRLSNSDELSVRHTQTMYDFFGNTDQLNYASITPSLAGNIAQKLDANTVIYGSLNTSGNKLRIIANLMDSRTNEIYKSYSLEADYQDNLFQLSDSISDLIKNFLEIKVIEQDADVDSRLFIQTESAQAYRYLSKGLDKFYIYDWESAIDLFQTALETDSNLLWAQIFLSLAYLNDGRDAEAQEIVKSLHHQIDEYEYVDQLFIKYYYNHYEKNATVIIDIIKKLTDEIPYTRGLQYEFGRFYANQMNQYNKAVIALEKSLEIDQKWGGGWEYMALYLVLGSAYHETGQHEKEQEIYELGLSINPNDSYIIFKQAVCAISRGDTIKGNEYIEKYKRMRESNGLEQKWTEFYIGIIFEEAEHYNKAITIYRNLIIQYPEIMWFKAQLASILVNQKINIDEGIELIEQVLKNNPGNYTFIETKGWGLYHQGHNKESLQLLKKAWDLRPLYDNQHYLRIKEVEQALASQNK